MAAKQRTQDKKETDWQRIGQRLADAAAALDRGVTPDREQACLKARARRLAEEPFTEDAAAERLEILEFSLAYETYALETSFVGGTWPLRGLTPLPCTPPFVLGLINVRGRIMSVIDIKRFFDLPEKGLTDLNKVIIVHDGGMEFGILADRVLGVRTVAPAEMEPALPTLTGVREEFLKGVTRERTVLLDGKRLINDKRIIVNEEVGD